MKIKIGGKNIGDGSPVFIIAELSANHNHDFNVAKASVKAIKESGADAVKLQTYRPDTITIDCNNKYFKIKQGTLWDGETLYNLYEKAHTPWEWQPKLKKYAESLGLVCFSTPFDRSSVDFLEKIKVPAYKIASFEITDIPLIEYVASKGKPVIISSGVSELNDIKDAVAACRRMKNDRIAILKCTSAYPAPLKEMNLSMIPDMRKKLKLVTGLSDHSLSVTIPSVAVALGAKIIEKHFILDKKMGGPDAAFSFSPKEFNSMVMAIRETEKAMGTVDYNLSVRSKKSREFARSLFVTEDIKTGERFSEKNIRSIRPGFGLHPKYIKTVLGERARIDIKRGTPLNKSMITK